MGVALALAALFSACGEPGPKTGPAARQSGAAAATVTGRPAAWSGDPIQITALSSDGTSLTLRVRLPEGAAPPDGFEPSGFNLTFPLGAEVSAKIAGGAVGGAPIDINRVDAGRAIKLRPCGLVRNWPLWHLDLGRKFWEPFRSIARGNGAVDVTLVIGVKPDKAFQAAKSTIPETHPMRRLAAALVANPGDLGRWETEPTPPVQMTDPRPLVPDGKTWLKACVETDGLYRISREALQAAGLIQSPSELERVRVFSLGKPVPVMVEDRGEDLRGVYFYGQGSKSKYSRRQAYWVTVSAHAAAARWAEYAPPAGAKPVALDRVQAQSGLENDQERLLEQDDLLSITGVEWVDRRIETTGTLELAVPIHRPAAGGDARARLDFVALGEPRDWKGTGLSLSIGDREIAKWRLQDPLKQSWSAAIPASMLRDGTNTLTLRVTEPTTATRTDADSEIWFDRIQVSYPATPTMVGGRFVFGPDSTSTPMLGRIQADPLSRQGGLIPLQIAGGEVRRIQIADGSFLVSNLLGQRTEVYDPARVPGLDVQPVKFDDEILRAGSPVDYLIIAHPSLMPALDPLLQLNQERGLSTRVVNIESLYDFFGDGVLNPEVIGRYLKRAMSAWAGGAPPYVLLFGDCNSDFLNRLRNSVPHLVPSYSYEFTETWASDAWFTMFCGDDNLPDTMLGRISVNNLKDAKAVVEKTVRYARNRTLGPWRARLTYVADETERGETFRNAAETLRSEWTPNAFAAHCIYLDDLPLEDNWYAPDADVARVYEMEKKMMKVSTAATGAILDAMNQGTAFLDFFGHGSPNIWCDERIWFGGDSQNRDTQHLKPVGGCFPFIVNYTCNTGAIDYPDPPWNLNISEDLMRTPEAGAVGMFVPSGPGTTPAHLTFARLWRRAMFEDNMRGFGEMSTLARLRLALGDGPRDMIYMYILLGDPALRLQLAQQWLPLNLSEPAINPDLTDSRHSAWVTGVSPASGQARIWVEDVRGKRLWEGEPTAYRDGRVKLNYQLPPNVATPADLRVCVYGWNPSQGRDFTAGALVKAERPRVKIEAVQVERTDNHHVRAQATVRNMGGAATGNQLLSLVSSSGDVYIRENVRLQPGEQRVVALTAGMTFQAEPTTVELQFAANSTPDDAAAPAIERIAYSISGDSITTATLKGAPRLRIVPASIRHDPEPVTEGHTIDVMFDVENAGASVSGPMIAELLDGPPERGGNILPIQSALPPTEIPALGAGRTWPVTLRWDPVYNAGIRKVWIRLKPVGGAPPANAVEQVATHSIFVRTKCNLARTKPVRPAPRTEEDIRLGRYQIHATVDNRGETEARGVEVSFYTGPEKRDDQLMGKVVLPKVPARGQAEAVLIWTYDKKRFPDVDTAHLPVTIEMRLLGSTQRYSG
ncbi:MAG: C25 family cysteine peptidase [Candidatus Sumerlaeia bacterium]